MQTKEQIAKQAYENLRSKQPDRYMEWQELDECDRELIYEAMELYASQRQGGWVKTEKRIPTKPYNYFVRVWSNQHKYIYNDTNHFDNGWSKLANPADFVVEWYDQFDKTLRESEASPTIQENNAPEKLIKDTLRLICGCVDGEQCGGKCYDTIRKAETEANKHFSNQSEHAKGVDLFLAGVAHGKASPTSQPAQVNKKFISDCIACITDASNRLNVDDNKNDDFFEQSYYLLEQLKEVELLVVAPSTEPAEGPCAHDAVIDSGTGYHYCKQCNRAWTIEEWRRGQQPSPEPVAAQELPKLKDFPHLVKMEAEMKKVKPGTKEYWELRAINREKMDDPTYSDFERSNCAHFHSILVNNQK